MAAEKLLIFENGAIIEVVCSSTDNARSENAEFGSAAACLTALVVTATHQSYLVTSAVIFTRVSVEWNQGSLRQQQIHKTHRRAHMMKFVDEEDGNGEEFVMGGLTSIIGCQWQPLSATFAQIP